MTQTSWSDNTPGQAEERRPNWSFQNAEWNYWCSKGSVVWDDGWCAINQRKHLPQLVQTPHPAWDQKKLFHREGDKWLESIAAGSEDSWRHPNIQNILWQILWKQEKNARLNWRKKKEHYYHAQKCALVVK